MTNLDQISMLCSFANGTFTPAQKETIDELISELSIADKENLLYMYIDLPEGTYTDLSMYNGEMGGLSRY